MDRKTYFKRKIFEMTDSQSVMKKSCRRKITFEDEMSDISQEPKKQCLELKLLTDVNTSTNQPLVSSEGALSPEIFLNNNLPIANSDVTDKAVIAASEESQAECRQNIITNNSNDENLEETVDISSELQVEDDSNLVLNTNTMTEKDTSSISASNKFSKRSSDHKLIKKTYCEFISDNEDPYFTDEFSSWNEKSGNDSNSDTPITKKSKKKTTKKNKLKLTEELDKETTTNEPLQEIIGKPDDISIVGEKEKKIQQTNTRKERKVCENSGKEYIQRNGKIRSKKEIKPNPCVGKKCGNNCQVITEERRLSLFNHFWTLSSERQRDWIVNMSRRITIKRKRSKDSGTRNYSFEYYINDNEDRQQFILNTLDVSETYMYYTLSNCIEGSSKEDLRGRHIPANKTKEATKQNVQNFIKKLPALPSHYCRRDTTKLYLPVEYKNHKNLYRIYKEEKTSAGIDYVSEKVFLNIFKTEFNIGFHVPKKDKCVKCIKLDAENTEESKAEKEEHLKEKIASKERYKSHRELSQKHSDVICTSFDLQKVLNTPHGESMLLYYSRKYAIYNLCFYENGSREGFCYIWGESEGKRGGNEIASIIQKYINLVGSRASVKHLLLYSDFHPGQNKNKIVLAALHNALKNCENILSIQINYLLPGHTEMSVDSMHSVIEGSVRNTIVWAPSQWATICQLARKDPKPYNVNYLDHTDFLGFDGFADKYFRGNLTGKISKIRVATFKKSKINQMAVKYSMKPDAEEEIIPVIGASNSKIVDRLYTTSLPITKVKYNNLKKLCDDNVIPKLYHREYLTLTSVSRVDTLTETDVEDVL